MNKTFAVRGMIDFQVDIPAGKAKVRIHFIGGAFTKYGNLPAIFTTSDAWLQHLIENCEMYRQGRIYQLD